MAEEKSSVRRNSQYRRPILDEKERNRLRRQTTPRPAASRSSASRTMRENTGSPVTREGMSEEEYRKARARRARARALARKRRRQKQIFAGIAILAVIVVLCLAVFVLPKVFKKTYEPGWIQNEAGNTVWQNKDGSILTQGGLQVIDGNTYFLEEGTGVAKKGLVSDKGSTYYFNEETGILEPGFHKVDGTTYYFDPETGAMVSGGLRTIDGNQYLFEDDGALVTNQRAYEIDGVRKMIDENGVVSDLTHAQELAAKKLDEVGWDLEKAFWWVVPMEYDYDLSETVPDGMLASEYFATAGFENDMGTCYVAAATFYEMAYMLGYDAHFIMGYIAWNGGYGDHGWVEIDQDGDTFVYDATLGSYGWKFHYGDPNTRDYLMYDRVP